MAAKRKPSRSKRQREIEAARKRRLAEQAHAEIEARRARPSQDRMYRGGMNRGA